MFAANFFLSFFNFERIKFHALPCAACSVQLKSKLQLFVDEILEYANCTNNKNYLTEMCVEFGVGGTGRHSNEHLHVANVLSLIQNAM